MTRHLYSLRTLLLPFLLLLSFVGKAQIYPVQITVQAIAPYPIYLNDFTQGMTDRLRVQLLLTDINVQSRRVRLKMSMSGGGINITNPEVVSGALPILLSGGMPEYLGNTELRPYFNPQNLPGLNPVAYTQPLPEGVYNLCFEAFDFITGEVLSRKSCYTMALIQNDPPFLSLPRNNESVPQQDPQSLLFQWTPRHINATNVSYEFSLLELLDTFINPQAAMQVMQPYYQTTTYSTSLWLGPADAPLTPGRKYAWRVRAKSLSGMDELGTFKNNGYSETWSFTYTDANCNAPLGLLVTDIARRSVKVQWMPIANNGLDDITYRISYRMHGGSDRWYDRQTSATELTIYDLDPETEYEFRVGRMCGGAGFVYGNSVYATTASTTDTTMVASCGLPPAEVDISNQTPLATLQPGETFTAGDFTVTALQVTGGGGNYSGDGFIVVPYLANAKVRVKFAGIFINSERKLAQGFVETTYDPTMSGVLDVDDIFEGGSGTGGVKTGTIVTDYHTDFPIGGVDDIHVTGPDDNPTITIGNVSNGGGSGLTIKPDSLPVSITDSKGDIYTVEPGGSSGTPVITKAGEQVPMQTSPAQLNQLAHDKGKVIFTQNSNTQYAFDAYKPEYGASTLWQKKYEFLGNEYRVAAKATLPGKPDRITAQITITDNNLQADKVQFVTSKGIKYASKHLSGNDYEVMLVGSPADDAQELYAVYPLPINTPADSGKYISLGKLLVAGYAPHTAKLVIVPVNGATADKSAIEATLNDTYKGIGISWAVQVAEGWNDDSWDLDHDNKLSVTGSNTWSVYTPEMQALNNAYKASHTLVSGAAYLFALPQAAPTENGATVYGDMPRGKRYGYLFNGSNGRTAAHEMGHGMFSLKHTFDNAYGFAVTALQDNLMSYGNGIGLSKLQWDAVHAPGLVIGVFEGDEDAMSFANVPQDETTISYLLDKPMNFVAMSGKVVALPQGAMVKFYCIDQNSCNTDGKLIGFKINGIEYVAKTSEISAPMGTFSGFFKLTSGKYSNDKFRNIYPLLSTGSTQVTFLHRETLANGKQQVKIITEEKTLASGQVEVANGDYAGNRSNYDFSFNSQATVASTEKLEFTSDCGNQNSDGSMAGNGDNYLNKKYLDELSKNAGKGNDPNVNKAPGAAGGDLYDYANTLTAAEKQKIINDLNFTKSSTGVEGRIYITDHLTPQATKSAIQAYLDGLSGKAIAIWVDFDADKKATTTIKIGSGIEGANDPAVSAYSGSLKENTWYSVLNIWGCEFNPLTAVLDGLAGLVGKLEIQERFYNPDLPRYNPLPAKIYNLVSGKVITNAVASAIFGTTPGYNDKYSLSRCDFALTCGVWNGAVMLVSGIPAGASFVVKLIVDENNIRATLSAKLNDLKWDDVKKMGSEAWNKYTANPCMVSYGGGHVVFFVASCFIGAGEFGAATKAMNVLEKIDVMGQAISKICKAAGVIIKPIVKQGGKFIKYGVQVGGTFVKTLRITRISSIKLYCALIPPIPFSVNVSEAFRAAHGKLKLLTKEQLESKLDNATFVTDNAGKYITDEHGNYLAEVEVDGEKIPVLVGEEDALKKVDEGVVGGLDFAAMDLPGAMQHVKFRELSAARNKGIVGCHDAVEFGKVRQVNAVGNPNYQVAIGKTVDEVEEIVITRIDIHPTIPGVKTIEYKLPALDIQQKTTGALGAKTFTKTIYDPAIWPDDKLEKALKEALQDAASKNNGSIPTGNPSPGFTSEGYRIMFTTNNGKVTSFWFD